jgi:hypothetical protein
VVGIGAERTTVFFAMVDSSNCLVVADKLAVASSLVETLYSADVVA